jgi:hypothetical protein
MVHIVIGSCWVTGIPVVIGLTVTRNIMVFATTLACAVVVHNAENRPEVAAVPSCYPNTFTRFPRATSKAVGMPTIIAVQPARSGYIVKELVAWTVT